MKVPFSWLKEYLDVTLSAEEFSKALTLAGMEVDGIDKTALKFSGVFVGEVVSTERHPTADRLTVAKVTDGNEEFQVVCGAANCRPGIKVAFAKIGAALEDEQGKSFKIKKSKLRDVESFGMLCSADELGLEGDKDGIMELTDSHEVGKDLSDYYSETIIDVSLTPNLGHCMSIFGVARDMAAILDLPLKKPNFVLKEGNEAIDIDVQLIDKKRCPRYCCRTIKGIQVGPSPEWLKNKLEACGVRSINNVVDVGNLVMLERGQPLHMFDKSKIAGNKIIITAQTSHEKLDTLDDQTRDIPPDVLLICDAESPLAFAGVMGGKSSAVTDETKDVIIESAYFTPQAIRQSCKWLGLKSDSSQRFEKGIDPNGVAQALDYAAYLLQQVAGGEISKGMIDVKAHEFEPKKIALRPPRVNKLLGTALSVNEMSSFLKRLGMGILQEGPNEILVSVPTFRNDISIEVDLIEEVGRVFGYNNIPKNPPLYSSSELADAPAYLLEKQMRTQLLCEGLQELMTCNLISPSQAEMVTENSLPKEALISVLQPSSIDQSVLRSTLLPGLLQVVKYNCDHGNPELAGFEVGRVHFKDKEKCVELTTAGIILTGKRSPYHWDPKPQEFDFFDLKGMVENALAHFRIANVTFETSHLHNFHPGRQAKIMMKHITLGVMGEVHPNHLKTVGIDQRVLFAELDLNVLHPLIKKKWKMAPIAMFPGSTRDWTMTIDEKVSIGEILKAIRSHSSPLLENVMLLGLYKSEQIGKDRKNATFRLFYRDREKTVSYETVEKEHASIVQSVEGQYIKRETS